MTPGRLQRCSTAWVSLGYYHGVIDGVMGPRTRAAVAAYESRHGLVVEGTISAPLLDRLGLA
jgi:peptidoglycan hydrolase-like protein with peptidoglycan-binding domain